MIFIKGDPLDIATLTEYAEGSNQRYILKQMSDSAEKYKYNSIEQLKFELFARDEIIKAAIALNDSDMEFAIFRKARSNPMFWKTTNEGGFRQNIDVKTSDAITDIYVNGREYATECATAMLIVYYKALINILSEGKFNNVIEDIYLMNWHSIDPLIKEVGMPRKVADLLPGDRAYFANPEVDPKFPEWQGENVIVLPRGLYYGHGIGITTADQIINALNRKRKPDADKSAYLMDSAGRPNFNRLKKTSALS